MLVAQVLMMLGVAVAVIAFAVTMRALWRKRWEVAHQDAGVVILALAIAGVGAAALSASSGVAVTYSLVALFVGAMLRHFGKKPALEADRRR